MICIGDGYTTTDYASIGHTDGKDIGYDYASSCATPSIGEGQGESDDITRIGIGRDNGFGDGRVLSRSDTSNAQKYYSDQQTS